MSMVRPLSRATFDAELGSATTPVVVDFYASWCPPCRAMALALDELAPEMQGRLAFFKVNVEEEPELAERFDVRSVPTLSVFAGSESIHDIPGYVPPAKLRLFLESVVRAVASPGTGVA